MNFFLALFLFFIFYFFCTITISSFSSSIAPRGTSLVAVEDEIFCGIVRDMQVDDPVHEIETDETNRKHDPRVFVDVRRWATIQLVETLRGDTRGGETGVSSSVLEGKYSTALNTVKLLLLLLLLLISWLLNRIKKSQWLETVITTKCYYYTTNLAS